MNQVFMYVERTRKMYMKRQILNLDILLMCQKHHYQLTHFLKSGKSVNEVHCILIICESNLNMSNG